MIISRVEVVSKVPEALRPMHRALGVASRLRAQVRARGQSLQMLKAYHPQGGGYTRGDLGLQKIWTDADLWGRYEGAVCGGW